MQTFFIIFRSFLDHQTIETTYTFYYIAFDPIKVTSMLIIYNEEPGFLMESFAIIIYVMLPQKVVIILLFTMQTFKLQTTDKMKQPCQLMNYSSFNSKISSHNLYLWKQYSFFFFLSLAKGKRVKIYTINESWTFVVLIGWNIHWLACMWLA